MKFQDDMSYIHRDLVDRGMAVTEPYSIRLDAYVSEERKAENRAFASTLKDLNCPEWLEHCSAWKEKVASEIHRLLEILNEHFRLGQYTRGVNGLDDCDLWFWCNTCGGERDYSYVTLSIPRDEVEAERKNEIFKDLKKLLSDYSCDCVQAHFQYGTKRLDDVIAREAERIFAAAGGRFVSWRGMEGRLTKDDEGRYEFWKKRARRYYYIMSAEDVCNIQL